MESSALDTLSNFLRQGGREDLRMVALHEVLSLTGSEDGCSMIEKSSIGKIIIEFALSDDEVISKLASLSLVNISATEKGANFLLHSFPQKQENISVLLNCILNEESSKADACCMILSNLTRTSLNATSVFSAVQDSGISVENLINAFTKKNFNSKGCNLNYLAAVFSNLSQNLQFRRSLMVEETCLIKKLFPFLQMSHSLIRRGGVVGTLRNCCFETGCHQLLLGPNVDILPCLLLPLAGPEELDEEENEKLPLELQYLEEEKQRESDPDIRKMLLEALLQLCATKFGREYLRSKNSYVILREYHKWEKDQSALLACENVVDILIRTEEEINEGNLKEIEVPNELVQKFHKMDQQYLEN